MEKIIEFKNVNKTYGLKNNLFYALQDINFTIKKGEYVVILGPSGAGKSTLLNLLGGMDPLTSGDIIVNGQHISTYKDNELTSYRAKTIGFIFQFYNLIPTLTALENVSLIKDIVSSKTNSEKVLQSVNLTNQVNQFPSELSGGEQQRVSIARAINKDPEIFLCDEPTGALDSENGAVVLELLYQQSRERNKTVIIVTHNEVLSQVADRVIYLKNGKIEKVIINETPLNISQVNW